MYLLLLSHSVMWEDLKHKFDLLLQVVANAVAAISEILETSQTAHTVLDLNSQIINKLLTALNECTE